METLKDLATIQETLDHVTALLLDAEIDVMKAHAEYETHNAEENHEQAVAAATRVLIFDARRKAMADLYKFITGDDFPQPQE